MHSQKRASAFPTCLNEEGILEHTDSQGQLGTTSGQLGLSLPINSESTSCPQQGQPDSLLGGIVYSYIQRKFNITLRARSCNLPPNHDNENIFNIEAFEGKGKKLIFVRVLYKFGDYADKWNIRECNDLVATRRCESVEKSVKKNGMDHTA